MTAQEIIEKIRAEVERRKKAIHSTLFNDEYNDFLSFLSDLEKSEKPSEDVEEEYKNYVENDPVYSKLVNGIVGLSIARHFAQWGAEHLKK